MNNKILASLMTLVLSKYNVQVYSNNTNAPDISAREFLMRNFPDIVAQCQLALGKCPTQKDVNDVINANVIMLFKTFSLMNYAVTLEKQISDDSDKNTFISLIELATDALSIQYVVDNSGIPKNMREYLENLNTSYLADSDINRIFAANEKTLNYSFSSALDSVLFYQKITKKQ